MAPLTKFANNSDKPVGELAHALLSFKGRNLLGNPGFQLVSN